jgi:hypothetical protein
LAAEARLRHRRTGRIQAGSRLLAWFILYLTGDNACESLFHAAMPQLCLQENVAGLDATSHVSSKLVDIDAGAVLR